jgi:hypothetical protein
MIKADLEKGIIKRDLIIKNLRDELKKEKENVRLEKDLVNKLKTKISLIGCVIKSNADLIEREIIYGF